MNLGDANDPGWDGYDQKLAKGLPTVLREWAGSYEEGSFDTEAGLMIEAADALDAALETLRWVRANYAAGSTSEINARIETALSKAQS